MTTSTPEIVFLGGSLEEKSKTNRVAVWCARQCAPRARIAVFTGPNLEFPFYRPHAVLRPRPVLRFLEALEQADGIVIVSPTYHGTTSGLLKNALDYVNELAHAPQPYLDGRALGCVSVSLGEQGAASTLHTLRTIGHALRSWPTPLGVTLSNSRSAVDTDGAPADAQARSQLLVMLNQVLTLARLNTKRRISHTASLVRDGAAPARPCRAGGTG